MAEFAGKKHTLMLDNRENLVITGAEDVNGFNEETVSVTTSDGTLIIRGSSLHIGKLNLETGDVCIDGKINAIQYVGSDRSRSGFSRLFR